MRFTKMHGAGNDYIYLDCTHDLPPDLPGLALRLSRPHFSVGSDGLICICPSAKADFRMRMFNADGSEGAMCGNGLRCLCKFVYDKGLTERTALSVETRSGVKQTTLHLKDGSVEAVTVDLGPPSVAPPMALHVLGRDYTVTPVDMGNPHAVLFLEDVKSLNLSKIGPQVETHPAFPGRVNAEFVEVVGDGHLYMRVWERGSGETLACGTGACAALVAAALSHRCGHSAMVSLPGGDLDIRWDKEDGHVYMTGGAVTVFEGEMNL